MKINWKWPGGPGSTFVPWYVIAWRLPWFALAWLGKGITWVAIAIGCRSISEANGWLRWSI